MRNITKSHKFNFSLLILNSSPIPKNQDTFLISNFESLILPLSLKARIHLNLRIGIIQSHKLNFKFQISNSSSTAEKENISIKLLILNF